MSIISTKIKLIKEKLIGNYKSLQVHTPMYSQSNKNGLPAIIIIGLWFSVSDWCTECSNVMHFVCCSIKSTINVHLCSVHWNLLLKAVRLVTECVDLRQWQLVLFHASLNHNISKPKDSHPKMLLETFSYHEELRWPTFKD